MNDSWLDDLMDETSNVETPKLWIWWSLVAAISATAGNNYFLRTLKGQLIYKPNLYIMLLGESGLGKGYPVNLAKLLVAKSDSTRVIAGRSSIQAIVSEMGTARTNPNGKPPFTDARVFIVNGELSSAIIADVDALAILTDLYDGHYNPEWTNLLKGEGAKKLVDPYVTALFGSSPAHFYDSIPQPNIEGGYIGRNLVVYEERRAQNLDLLDDDEGDDDRLKNTLVPKYSKHLVDIASHKGRLAPTPDAKLLYNTWRTKWRAEQKADKTGFINRVPDHVLKVSMCLCLARYNSSGIIQDSDIKEAIDKVTKLIYANRMTTEGRGLDPLAGQTKIILDFLIASKDNELTRKQLLSKGYGNYDASTLDRITDTLIEMGWVQRERFAAGTASDWIIKLAGEPLQNYKKFIAKRDDNGKIKS